MSQKSFVMKQDKQKISLEFQKNIQELPLEILETYLKILLFRSFPIPKPFAYAHFIRRQR